jgi:uncharacterized membrane protein
LSTPQPPLHPRNKGKPEHVARIEIIISDLLRIGVIASLFVIVVGTALTFVHHRDYFTSRAEFHRLTQSQARFPNTLHDTWQGLRQLEGRAIVVLGLLLLIATPVLRVAVSIVAFAVQRDRTFVVLTSIVLALLILSFFLGKVEG